MATKTITAGAVEFNGTTLEMGKPVLLNGRKATPFMAWVRDDHHAIYAGLTPRPNTDVRFKIEGVQMPSDFNDRFGRKAVIEQIEAAA